MAVTFTAAELAAALRIGDSNEEMAEAERLLGYCAEAISRHLGATFATTPDVIVNEAVRRLAGYLFSMPEAGRFDGYGNPMRNSGASRILLPYLVHRAGYSSADTVEAAQQAVGTDNNPVVDVDLTGSTLTVTYADGTNETFTIAAGGGGVDQTARDAAAAAQTTADTATAAAGDASAAAANAGTAAAAAEVVAGTAQTAAEDALTTATDAQRAAASNATTIGQIGTTQAQIAPLITENAADIAARVVAANNHAADPDAHHTPPVGGGAPAAFEVYSPDETDLTNAYVVYQTIDGASLRAGQKYRVTSTSFCRAIGDGVQKLEGRMHVGTTIISSFETITNPEGTTGARWGATLDRIITMPDPAADITMSFREATAGFVRLIAPTCLIVMEVS